MAQIERNPDRTSSQQLITPQSKFESRSLNLNPGVAKHRDPGVLFCAGGETGRVIPRIRKGLRRSEPVDVSLPTSRATRLYSHARPSDAPFLAQTLGRLSVSRRLGYRGVALAQSVATYRGWLRRVEAAEIEMVMASGYRTIRPASRAEPPRPGLAGPLLMSHRRVTKHA